MEKAAKSRGQKDRLPPMNTEHTVTKTAPIQTPKAVKRTSYTKDHSIDHNKAPNEILHAKRRKEDEQEQNLSQKNFKPTADKVPGKYQPDPVVPFPDSPKVGEVRVKTLEEIRKEKAARIQSDEVKSPNTEENGAKKPRLQQNDQLTSHGKRFYNVDYTINTCGHFSFHASYLNLFKGGLVDSCLGAPPQSSKVGILNPAFLCGHSFST